MELSLNLLWLSISFVFTSVWLFRWRSGSRAGAVSGVALGCALILLFPSISLTDDLHPQIIALDGAAGKRTTSQSVSRAGGTSSRGSATALWVPAHALTAILSSGFIPGALAFGGIVSEISTLPAQVCCNFLSGRSPPALPLR